MGVMTPGKIHPSHDCLYVSFGGYEYSYKHNYEILVSRGPSEWLSETKGKYFIMICNLSIALTKTKYIKLNTKPQNIFFCLNENLTTFLYTLTGATRKFSYKVYTKVECY